MRGVATRHAGVDMRQPTHTCCASHHVLPSLLLCGSASWHALAWLACPCVVLHETACCTASLRALQQRFTTWLQLLTQSRDSRTCREPNIRRVGEVAHAFVYQVVCSTQRPFLLPTSHPRACTARQHHPPAPADAALIAAVCCVMCGVWVVQAPAVRRRVV